MSVNKYIIFFFFLFLVASLSLLGVFLWYRAGYLKANKVSVVSEVANVNFRLNNEEELLKYLDKFNFWEGVIENPGSSNTVQIKPKRLIVHITDKQFAENRTEWVGGIYAASTTAKVTDDGAFHIWIGVNSGFFKGTYSNPESWLDNKLLTAVFTRSVSTNQMSDEVLKSHRKEKAKSPPFFIIENTN